MTRREAPVFSAAAIGWIVGLTAGSLGLAIVWTGLAGDLAEPHTAGSDSYSHSALGHRAFADLLRRSGMRVTRRRTHYVTALDRRTTIVLAEPPAVGSDTAPGDSTIARLFAVAAARGAPLIMVLPKRTGVMDPARPRWIATSELLSPGEVSKRMAPFALGDLAIVRRPSVAAACKASWGETLSVSLSQAQLLAPSPQLVPLVTCDSLLLVACWAPAGEDPRARGDSAPLRLYLVSDPDLISNLGLGAADNAAVVSGLLAQVLEVGAVWFDETLHHPVLTVGLLTELFRFPLVLAVAQATLALAFLMWSKVTRFGKAEAPISYEGSKRALVDSIAGLLTAAGRPAYTLQTYFGQVMRDTGERYGLTAGPGPGQIAARLAEIARTRGVRPDILELALQVDRLQFMEGRRSHAVVRAALDLHRWREAMSDDR